MPFMSLSVPDESISWNRVLPKPTTLLHDHFNDPFPRRDSSLLHHYITSDKSYRPASDDGSQRRLTVPSIAYSEVSRFDQPPLLSPVRNSNDPASAIYVKEGFISNKRTASLMEHETESREPSPSAQNQSEESGNHFCLCQPDPKIPRPRNAFILYRQHHQAAVVAKHPGLPNPEISKVLGKQWSGLPAHTKKRWQELAEEEKARHQQQYPDYRYQPRRSNRNSHISSNIVSEPSGTSNSSPMCQKCGGKIMHPPMTPAAPHSPTNPAMPHPLYGNTQTPRRGYTIIGQRPSLVHSPPQGTRVRSFAEVSGAEPRARFGPMPSSPTTPDPKRRRINEVLYIANRGEGAETQYVTSPRRVSVARPEFPQHSRAVVGPPPQRIAYPQQRNQSVQISPRKKVDHSLNLAPLNIQAPSQAQKGGVEAMIKSIPVLNKIKILGQAAPPLATPGPASPPYEVRGAILAIEGLDPVKVTVMTNYLTEELGKSDKFSIQKFLGPASLLGKAVNGKTCPLHGPEDFLQTISDWHKVSREMCKFITTRPANPEASGRKESAASVEAQTCNCGAMGEQEAESSSQSKDTGISNTANGDTGEPTESNSPPGSRTIVIGTDALSIKSPTASKVPSSDDESLRKNSTSSLLSNPSNPSTIPVAVVPRYQLTTVDASAISMSITDSYSPLDHWRWLAALWRGCVGPDVTIVVQGRGEGDSRAGSGSGGENWESGDGKQGTGVDVRLQDARTVIVKVGVGDEIERKALRRVGFEVEEFLRR